MNPLSSSQATGLNSLRISPPSKLQTAIDSIVNKEKTATDSIVVTPFILDLSELWFLSVLLNF